MALLGMVFCEFKGVGGRVEIAGYEFRGMVFPCTVNPRSLKLIQNSARIFEISALGESKASLILEIFTLFATIFWRGMDKV